MADAVQLGEDACENELAEMNCIRERKRLEGAQDHELPGLRKRGYAPETYETRSQTRLYFELESSTK
jgi:hypothetical protein